MSFTEIAEKCPKAYNEYRGWCFVRNCKCHYARDLYDFFDEKGIYVTITYFTTENVFSFRVHEKYNSCNSFDTRKEAEEAAFLKTFEILEGKL